MAKRLSVAMIGGGEESFIGPVHARAIAGTLRGSLVAGVFSRDSKKRERSAKYYGVDPTRSYETLEALLSKESSRQDRVDLITIATSNEVHYEQARASLEAGFHVLCEKPLTLTFAESLELYHLAQKKERIFAVAYVYACYPMARKARALIAGGEIGEVQAVRVRYLQDWLQNPNVQNWRLDPQRGGKVGTIGDIGTHAFQMVRFMTDFKPESVLCIREKHAPVSRELEDYAHIVMRGADQVLATLDVSQATHGFKNAFTVEADGTLATLRWDQERPGELWICKNEGGQQKFIQDRNDPGAILPAGHPEGYQSAFGVLYEEVFNGIEFGRAQFPDIRDGFEGMKFIECCLASAERGSEWVEWKL